ncbi:unnamed protein product, partial [marine sediment metagenome]
MKTLKVTLQVAITICFTFFIINYSSAQPTTREVSGDITENTTWADDTILVTGDIVVNEDITLSINPGTWIKFQGNYGIEVHGYLVAEGIPGDTIIFTRMDTLGFSNYSNNQGGWKGLAFVSDGTHQDTSRLSLCKISFVKCIENNYGGIYNSGTHKLKIWNCTIENNFAYQYGGGIYSSGSQGATLLITDCMITNNYAGQYGGGIYGTYKTRIINSSITDNYSGQWGGGIYLGYCDDIIS